MLSLEELSFEREKFGRRFSLVTNHFRFEVELKDWREDGFINASRFADGGDVILPLPLGKSLVIAFFSWHIPFEHNFKELFETPFYCREPYCEFRAETPGELLQHDTRVHRSAYGV